MLFRSAMFFLMTTFSLRLLILVWQGSYLMIIVISALNLQEHCKYQHLNITLYTAYFSDYVLLLTRGYTAPEYAIHGQLSEKVDTYSFGVVILEIISGRKSNDTRLEPETQYLLESVSIFLLKTWISWCHTLAHMTCIFQIATSQVFDSSS